MGVCVRADGDLVSDRVELDLVLGDAVSLSLAETRVSGLTLVEVLALDKYQQIQTGQEERTVNQSDSQTQGERPISGSHILMNQNRQKRMLPSRRQTLVRDIIGQVQEAH